MPTMKKENVTTTFESEQLAALEFSLKKKNTSVQPHSARCPSPPSGKTGEAAAAGGASLCVGVT